MSEMDNFEKIKARRFDIINKLGQQHKFVFHNSLYSSNMSCIKAKCYECIGFEDIANAVKDCKGWGCPLYFNRPYQYDDTICVKKLLIIEESKLLPDIGNKNLRDCVSRRQDVQTFDVNC